MVRKLNLFKDILPSLDNNNLDYYSGLTEDEKKEYIPFVLMRWLSSAPKKDGLDIYYLLMVNKFVNSYLWELYGHTELAHKLLASCGVGRSVRHSWIKPNSRTAPGPLKAMLLKTYIDLNEDEFDLILQCYDENEIKEMCLGLAMDDKEISKIIKDYKNAKKSNT